MRIWTPRVLYESKPWALISTGLLLGVGMMLWSLAAGAWTPSRSLLCFVGFALSLIGGATLQMRQDYRARSKWRRESGPN